MICTVRGAGTECIPITGAVMEDVRRAAAMSMPFVIFLIKCLYIIVLILHVLNKVGILIMQADNVNYFVINFR